jgi:ATP-dependent Lon protease
VKACQQLDVDHYSLDKIKKRLIEYLAVIRLKQLAVEDNMNEKVLELMPDAVIPIVIRSYL